MRYLLTDGASHRDLADSPELPAVTGADGDDGLFTLFIDKDAGVGVAIGELAETSRRCSVGSTYIMRG